MSALSLSLSRQLRVSGRSETYSLVLTDRWLDSPSHMQHLYSVCRAKTKIWKALSNGTHNDTVAEPNYFQYIAEFIREHVLKES